MERPWTVLQPSKLTQIDEGLWCITDIIPGIKGVTRRMTIAKRADGGLVFYNAIPLTDALLAEVNALGKPAQLILPHHLHMMDGHAFAERLQLPAYAPAACLSLVKERLPSAQDFAAFPKDDALEVHSVEGLKTGELVLLVKRAKATTLITADLVCNASHVSGFNGFMMRMIGFTADHPILPRPVRMRVGKDMNLVKDLLRKLAATPNLKRLVPSHGEVFEKDVPAALQHIAQGL